MSNTPLVRGKAIRVTRLDGCGEPVLGPDSVIVSKGFVSVTLNPNTDAGTAVQVTNANGDLEVDDTPIPRFTSYSVDLAFTGCDPALFSVLTGQPVVLSADGNDIVGYRQNSKVDVSLVGFALETWTGVFSSQCSPDGTPAYGYILLPYLKGGTIGGITVQNGSIDFTITGATTRDGNAWGDGPFNVTRDAAGLPGPLNEPLDVADHKHLEIVTVAPPAATDGLVALGVEATGATAGSPGSYTPANSYGPANFADLTTAPILTASPSTAWTTGQYIVLRDGSTAHWTGTAWAVGPA